LQEKEVKMKIQRAFGLILLSFLLLLSTWSSTQIGQAFSQGEQHTGGGCEGAPPVETTFSWLPDLQQVVSMALCNRPADILPGEFQRLILTSLDFLGDGSWATATVVMRPEDMSQDYESLLLFPSLMVVMHREDGNWDVALEGTERFEQMIQQSPPEVFGREMQVFLRDEAVTPQGIPDSLNLRWPWKDNQQWVYTQGPHPHCGPNSNCNWEAKNIKSALDFAPRNDIPAQNREVRAAATGLVVRKCVDSIQTDVILRHSDGYATGYLHIDKNTAAHLMEGQTTVPQGGRLGITYNGYNFGSTCGGGTGPHLHFYVGRWSNSRFQFDSINDTVISGWTSGSDGCFTRSGQQRKCVGAQITSDNSPATLISIGQTVNGEINPAGEQDIYYFDGSSGQEVTIEMTKSSGNLDPYIVLHRPNGSYLAYNDDGAGFPNARLVICLPESGRYELRAKSYSSSQTGGYTLRVTAGSGGRDTDDGRWLVHDGILYGRINPVSDEDWYYFSGLEGRIVNIRMVRSEGGLDSYLELYDPNGRRIAYDDDGGGWDTRNAWLITVLPRSGVYRVKARSYNHASSGPYSIRLRIVDANNYALNRPAYASSVESSIYAPFRAVDGRLDTRWSSQFRDPQWIYVDLGQNRTFDTVILRWEAAYAKRYGIYIWTGSIWRNVFWTNNGGGGTVMIRFPRTTARYVLMYGVERGTPWGYSLWEFGVYNSLEATAPIVPPEDPDKDPDTVDPLAPMPLPEEEEGKEVLALYLGDGESAQEVEATPDTDPGETPATTTGQEGLPTALIEYITPGYPGGGVVVYPDQVLEFSGSAEDNDAEGEPGIVAYEWVSDSDGFLSNQQTFTLMASSLSPGEHIISFRAQDNEGNWSEWDSVTVQVESYRLFLPLVLRNR